jgi:transposase InsO family protein
VAADTLNDAVIPFFDAHELPPLRVLTDRGSECCENREHHEYALYLEVENTGHTGTKAKSPQTDGICERFNKTRKDEFYAAAFRRKACRSVAELQPGPVQWARRYNGGADARREIPLREDADADLHGFDAVSQRKTDWLR